MAVNFLKRFSRFERDGSNISRILETNFPKDLGNHLPFWDGMHTIKKSKRSELLPNRINNLELTKENVVRGYLAAEDAKSMHIISQKKKLVKKITSSYYHAIADDLAEIVYGISVYPDSELVIDVSDIRESIDKPSWDFIGFFLRCLDSKKIKYTLIEMSKFDVIYMNNFALLSFPFHSGARLDMLSDFFMKYVDNKKEKPYRKVYVSRKKLGVKMDDSEARNFSYKNDNRIDDHDKIEKIFYDLGFEIVYPEDFKSFQEQLNFFYSVKTLASLTSSGIVNAVFMQPGSTIIEVVTPLITNSPLIDDAYLIKHNINPKDYEIDINVVQEVHMFYHNLAFFKNHSYIGIPNYTRNSDKLLEFINSNGPLKELLEK